MMPLDQNERLLHVDLFLEWYTRRTRQWNFKKLYCSNIAIKAFLRV